MFPAIIGQIWIPAPKSWMIYFSFISRLIAKKRKAKLEINEIWDKKELNQGFLKLTLV